ncbi:putative leucine-rich repeat-containing, plant-type, leucine-rich repeat domain superfamily [Helianthus annuus]|uniref:Leucine-rich repeat-containing, plant-type, leucine-rich repeat domain superfamily n=1 Tax=Helianthus annuus TaxID=4232 RepID=A0A251TFX0_HELAN|nr:probably inactive leucine-rich repeat receptor-like protein kinase IMK2 [Helianthus annuus]KAF5785120.1 putative leucine-rich repeat-containing, plant-type, leucine-rich repeat domain superfamily [Helianthus annuus]KAJ0528839.1 putative leucine-rich repeat-containing, plant-type, leucine-rich repeat domain superfamily [Helianthus annuus]KAJ0695754.1 putative leucine-rich repeat-containing, plant-type, leucine-rich repeat domain superfamily [Helianthus annuus]
MTMGITNKISLVITTTLFIQYSLALLHPIDFLALQSIKKSLEDMPGSTYFSSWDFTSDPCNFAGVFCVGQRVVTLNLGDPRAGTPGLSGRLDPDIGKLKNLVEFTLVPGRVMGAIPATLSELKNLRFIGISRNFISGEIPATLGELTGLRTLDLSYNQLTGNVPWAVGNLPALTNVVMCHNRLSGSVPAFVSQTLTRLDLKHNNLSGSIPPGFLPSSLQYLSLSWNRFSGPVDVLLSQLNRLNYLDLSLNRFTGPIPGSVFGFPISNLQLERNMFSGPVQPFNEVVIQTVDLSHNMLYGEVSPLFSSVKNLYLNYNRFTGSVPTTLVDRLLAGEVELLYLQHNYLTAVPMNPNAAIPMSSLLCLQYNCMVPPVQTSCPVEAGTQKTRPASQCMQWKG